MITALSAKKQFSPSSGEMCIRDRLGPDKPPVARVQTLFIRKIIVKIEVNAPMVRARELLMQVQKEMIAEDRFKSLIVYYDVDPM